jgi:hypothetical protein
MGRRRRGREQTAKVWSRREGSEERVEGAEWQPSCLLIAAVVTCERRWRRVWRRYEDFVASAVLCRKWRRLCVWLCCRQTISPLLDSNLKCSALYLSLSSIGLSVPRRKHIRSPLRAQQVNAICRFVRGYINVTITILDSIHLNAANIRTLYLQYTSTQPGHSKNQIWTLRFALLFSDWPGCVCLCTEDTGFECRPGHRLSSVRNILVPLSLCKPPTNTVYHYA